MSRVAGVRAETVGLVAVLAVATVLRFVDLPTRGTWDADQGHDMSVLWGWLRDGTVPLLGPRTSIGEFHHGVLYYYLLAPAAFLSGADPLAVVGLIAVGGVLAVAVVWWLARAIAGPVAGLVAGALMAVSASAIEESTFIWNPNLIALSSALALAAAWRAWTTRDPRWWIGAGAAQAVTMHCHVLGWVMVVPLVALLVADGRRRDPGSRGPVVRSALVAAAVILASYGPLLVHELATGFAETRALADYLGAGNGEHAPLSLRLAVVPLRVLSWPLTGLITTQPVAGLLAAVGVVAVLVWRARAAQGQERLAARWLGASLAWSALGLAIGAPSLASVVPGLPNDHYHAFLDPIVFVAAGLGGAALWRRGARGRLTALATVAALVALNVTLWPPRVAPDGGYPQAEAAAARMIAAVRGERYALDGLPALKNTDAYGFPLRRLGSEPVMAADTPVAYLVIVCDRLLEPIIATSCGGPAEDARAARLRPGAALVERFPASARTVVSVYR